MGNPASAIVGEVRVDAAPALRLDTNVLHIGILAHGPDGSVRRRHPVRLAEKTRNVRAFLIALVVALGGLPAIAPARTMDTLTVVTLNLWHDQHDWPSRLDVILAEMRRIRPDVLCLQEVLQNPSLRNQAETLGDSLGCHVQFATVDGPERPKRYGNAILTPHPVLVGESRNLAPADDYRAVAHVRFEWRGRAIDAYCTHLHHTSEGGSIRAAQIRHLLAYVDSTRGDGPTVIAGDFNSELGTPEMNLVTARHLDVFRATHPKATRAEASTYNSRFGPDPGAIDHIFVERQAARRLVPLACDVIFRTVGPDSVWASDHFGLVGKLAMRK
jgi:endonuclease/exonuclease/phosphatase family metal-dependent hydrolase